MKCKKGSKVRIVKVVETTNEKILNSKKKCIGKEGYVYSEPCKFYNCEDNGYSQNKKGSTIYSVKDESGKDISMYAWFKEELELIKD